jgi:hypothetical protein
LFVSRLVQRGHAVAVSDIHTSTVSEQIVTDAVPRLWMCE